MMDARARDATRDDAIVEKGMNAHE